MKTCRKCKEAKPKSEFPGQPRMADGLSSWCKTCKYASQKKWREANPEKYRSSLKNYYERNKPKHKEMAKAWKANNPEKVRAINAKYQQSLKRTVLEHYGMKCSCPKCPEQTKTVAFLTIDHVNGDGKEHRNTFKKNFYLWLIENEYPNGFQTLCFNCNIGRFWNGGVCPHMD